MCAGRLFCHQTSVKHLLTGVTDCATAGSWCGWWQGAPAGFLFSWNAGVTATCGCSLASPFGFPLWDLLRPHSRGQGGHLLGRASAVVIPQKRLLVVRGKKPTLPWLWELGWLYPTLAGSSGDPYPPPGFCKPQRAGKSAEVFKNQRGIQTWPENPWDLGL